jgi:hypothetical protein
MSASYLRDWQRRFYDNKAGYMEMATWDPFVDWDKNRMPELLCENALILGLKILYGRLEPHLAQVFLDQCIAMCNRIVSERTVQSDACIGSFPKNRGRVTRSLYYASALNGIQREDSELGAASQDFAEWCHNSCVSWDAQSQSYYLTAVRLALLAHDVERAWRLGEARAKRGFRHQADLWQITRATLEAARSGPSADSLSLVTDFFDLIRDPGFRPSAYSELDILRLEVSALRELYCINPGQPICWERVVCAISE